jgi:hypothetical protein
VIVLEASEPLLHRAGAAWTDLTAALLAAGYAVMRLGRWGLTTVDREASNWLAVPLEQRPLLARIDRALRRQAWSPIWLRERPQPPGGSLTESSQPMSDGFPHQPGISDLERLTAEAIDSEKRGTNRLEASR